MSQWEGQQQRRRSLQGRHRSSHRNLQRERHSCHQLGEHHSCHQLEEERHSCHQLGEGRHSCQWLIPHLRSSRSLQKPRQRRSCPQGEQRRRRRSQREPRNQRRPLRPPGGLACPAGTCFVFLLCSAGGRYVRCVHRDHGSEICRGQLCCVRHGGHHQQPRGREGLRGERD